MRIHTAAPSNANDTAGTVVGDQTSTRETKTEIQDYSDIYAALSMVTQAPLHTFKYIKDVNGYGADSPLAKTRIGFIADEVPAAFMWGNSIDQVSVNGLLMASVQALQKEIEQLKVAAANSTAGASITTQPLYLSTDSVGQGKILGGSTSVRVVFSQAYEYQPIVTISPNSRVGSEYWVGDKDASGFTIYIDAAAGSDIVFDWHAFASPEAKLTVSNGTTEAIALVVPAPPVVEDVVVPSASATLIEDTSEQPEEAAVEPLALAPEAAAPAVEDAPVVSEEPTELQ